MTTLFEQQGGQYKITGYLVLHYQTKTNMKSLYGVSDTDGTLEY